MDKTYFTKSEDGSFRPVTITKATISEMLAGVIEATLTTTIDEALTSSVKLLVESSDIIGKAQAIIDGTDLDATIEDAIDRIDIEDMVREEVQSKIENMDVSVDVSI